MIKSKIFRKIALWQLGLILATALVIVLLVTPRVERETLEQLEESLDAQAAMLRDASRPVLTQPATTTVEAFDARVRALGQETGTRFTVIAADGMVLVDSLGLETTLQDPHGNRPEIQQARSSGVRGASTRHSRTTGLDFRYVALPVFEAGTLVGYARTSFDMSAVDRRRAALWGHVGLGVAVAALLALIGGLILSRRFATRLGAMSAAARRMALGEPAGWLPTDRRDEEGDLARAIQEVDLKLRDRLDTLARERNELSGVLGSMHEGVVAVDREQRVVHMNALAREYLHVKDGNPVSQPLWDTTRIADVSDLIDQVLDDGEERSAEIRVADHPPARTLEVHVSPLEGHDGSVAGVVLVLHDVTELRRLEAMRTEFVANVSHELKTPLAAIQGLVETLADDGDMDAEVRQRFLGRARSQVLRLSSLVTDLLALSQVESEARTLERSGIDLRDVARESARRLDLTGRSPDLTLSVELPDEPVPVLGDEEALGRAVDNLLDNAVKYTESGGRIRLRLAPRGDSAVVTITDTGIGIEERHLDRIFERFYRVDKARSRALGGTGLGLAIVKHLVEAHGGGVQVESEAGAGSTFRILLPLDPLDAPGREEQEG